MNRREFTYSVAAAGIAGMISSKPIAKRARKPFRLNQGDLIGMPAPAGIMSEAKIASAIAKLEDYGFRVQEGKFLRATHGYLAGTDEQRLSDFHEMYRDPEVKGIWCARGGYGCTRLLGNLDYSLIRKNPKVLLGYSDITALLNAIYQKTGIIGFHGPVASSADNEYSRSTVRDLLMFPQDKVEIAPYENAEVKYQNFKTYKGGVAEGTSVGGNLSLMAAMAGTPFEIKCKNRIVFIEDVGEEPYRIDRMLTQLLDSTELSLAAGIVLGQFKGCNPDNPERSLSLLQVLEDRVVNTGVPCAYGFNFGHVDHNFTFPIGGKVKVDFDSGIIYFEEKMVL